MKKMQFRGSNSENGIIYTPIEIEDNKINIDCSVIKSWGNVTFDFSKISKPEASDDNDPPVSIMFNNFRWNRVVGWISPKFKYNVEFVKFKAMQQLYSQWSISSFKKFINGAEMLCVTDDGRYVKSIKDFQGQVGPYAEIFARKFSVISSEVIDAIVDAVVGNVIAKIDYKKISTFDQALVVFEFIPLQCQWLSRKYKQQHRFQWEYLGREQELKLDKTVLQRQILVVDRYLCWYFDPDFVVLKNLLNKLLDSTISQ